MQLNSSTVINNGYVKDRDDNYLNLSDYINKSSIDLTIGEVIYKDKDDEIQFGVGASLKPQQSLLIISNEIVRVPDNHVAYVFLKNRLCQKGLLALNTGIIDSGYIGPISTIVINFSNVTTVIPKSNNKDEKAFFRVVFHEISTSVNCNELPSSLTKYDERKYDKYKNERIDNLKNLPKTFLEQTYLKDQIKNEIYNKLSEFSIKRIGIVIAILGVIFSIISLAGSYGKDMLVGWSFDLKENMITQEKNKIQISNLNEEVELLKIKIEKLENISDKRD